MAEEVVIEVVLIPVGTLHDTAAVVKLVEAVKEDEPLAQTVCTCHS